VPISSIAPILSVTVLLNRRGRPCLRFSCRRGNLSRLHVGRFLTSGWRQSSFWRRCGTLFRGRDFPSLFRSRIRDFRPIRFAINARRLASGWRSRLRTGLRRFRRALFRLDSLRLSVLFRRSRGGLLVIALLLSSRGRRRCHIRAGSLFNLAVPLWRLRGNLLVIALLDITLLFVIPLLFPTGRGRRFAARLFRRTLVGALCVAAPHVFGTGRFADYVTNRSRRYVSASGPSNGVDARAFVRENGPLSSIKIDCFAIEVIDDTGAVDNSRVVHNKITPAMEVIAEMVDIAERKERGR
jgi:hypothetical protein